MSYMKSSVCILTYRRSSGTLMERSLSPGRGERHWWTTVSFLLILNKEVEVKCSILRTKEK